MEAVQVDVVCPVYKGFNYLKPLIDSFKLQKNVQIHRIVFPLTITEDDETDKIKELIAREGIISFDVMPEEFSHSITRERAMKEFCESNYVIMLSQDIKLIDEYVFYNLVKDIASGQTVYNYARQICTAKTIEKYIREKNYPKESQIVSSKDIERLQLMAFFASDACSAYNRKVFLKLGGYGGYDVMMNEDQLYSKIILDAGYKKKYCADAIVEHYHKYTLRQLYKRYYETGIFYSKVSIFDAYKTTDAGLKLALYVLKQALKHFNIPVLLRWLPDMTARYLGMRKGKKEGKKL